MIVIYQYPDDSHGEKYPDDSHGEKYPDDSHGEKYPDDSHGEKIEQFRVFYLQLERKKVNCIFILL